MTNKKVNFLAKKRFNSWDKLTLFQLEFVEFEAVEMLWIKPFGKSTKMFTLTQAFIGNIQCFEVI